MAGALAVLPAGAGAEQSSQPGAPVAGTLTAGNFHSCLVLASAVRCWGYGANGALGYGNTASIGDDDEPRSGGPIDFGAGRTVTAIAGGDVHSCALLDNARVSCWGFGVNGRLGYGNETTIGDDESPGSAGPVDLGAGRTAKAISAGGGHSCAILDDDALRCWGFAIDGRLGYNNLEQIGDNETPGSAGPVDFGPGHTVKAVSAGGYHTCAVLEDDTVRCWGFGGAGRLGYGNTDDVGRGCIITGAVCVVTPAAPSPASVGPVDLGAGRTAKALASGVGHTCAILDDGNVRCWGYNGSGRLGTGTPSNVGDNETPGSVAPVNLGPGRTAKAISAGDEHTCVILDTGDVRCWGYAAYGQIGSGNVEPIGDDEAPASIPPVALGAGRTAIAISATFQHACALLDDQSLRCWGNGANGRLGYCNELRIGDDELPSSAGPVALGQAGIAGARCPAVPPPPPPPPPPSMPPAEGPAATYPAPAAPAAPNALQAALSAQRERAAALRGCLRTATRSLAADRRSARGLPGTRRRAALRRADQRAAARRMACLKRFGRTPGSVRRLRARAARSRAIRLTFEAVGTDGRRLPAARRYVIKQSRRPIRTAKQFTRAPALCKGTCSFAVTEVGKTVVLTVTGLRRRGVYHYAIVAMDNVSGRRGPRSKSIRVRAG